MFKSPQTWWLWLKFKTGFDSCVSSDMSEEQAGIDLTENPVEERREKKKKKRSVSGDVSWAFIFWAGEPQQL